MRVAGVVYQAGVDNKVQSVIRGLQVTQVIAVKTDLMVSMDKVGFQVGLVRTERRLHLVGLDTAVLRWGLSLRLIFIDWLVVLIRIITR